MSSESETSRRLPLVLAIYCVLVLLVTALRTAVVFVNWGAFSDLRITYMLAHKLLVVLAIVGMMLLRREGVYGYALLHLATVVIYVIWPPEPAVPRLRVFGGAVVGLLIFAAVTLPFWSRFRGPDVAIG